MSQMGNFSGSQGGDEPDCSSRSKTHRSGSTRVDAFLAFAALKEMTKDSRESSLVIFQQCWRLSRFVDMCWPI